MRKRLLVIEDDFDVAELLLIYFNRGEYEVVHAETGARGVELARTSLPHLILLDVMLPDIDGYEVCYTLRQTALTRYVPIIFLSQRDERASKVMGLALGADDYITKPFDIEELWLRVQGAITRATRDSLHEVRSGLPTGYLVHEERNRRHDHGVAGIELVFTIEHFQAFRDVYGFMVADEVFAFTGNAIREMVGTHGTQDDFVGVLEDNFYLMTYADNPSFLVDMICEAFADGSRKFYPERDVQQGGTILHPQRKKARIIPLMSLGAYVTS